MSVTHVFKMKSGLTTDEVMDLLYENLPFNEDVDKKWKSLTTINEAMGFTVVDGRPSPEVVERIYDRRRYSRSGSHLSSKNEA